MLNWLRRKSAANSTIAVCPSDGGLAAALVRRDAARVPTLVWADYYNGTLEDALSQLKQRAGVADVPCTTLADLGTYSLILAEKPDVPDAELREAVRWQIKDMTDLKMDEAVVDLFEVPTFKGGNRNMIYAVIAPTRTIGERISLLSDAGLNLETVDIPEFAIRNLAALMPADVGGIAFVHLVDRVGLITVTRKGELYLSRRFEFHASVGQQTAPDSLGAETHAAIEDVVIEIQRSLDYYESQFGQPTVQAIAVSAVPAIENQLTRNLTEQLGINAIPVVLAELIEIEHPVPDASYLHCVSAVGAALRESRAA